MPPDVVRVRSAAKINLTLEVGPPRPDGYHEICSVVQTIGLWDRLELTATDSDIDLECNWPDLASDENLCVRAARMMRERFSLTQGCRVKLDKAIPYGAGLGGGSGNAAAMLVALCSLWQVEVEGAKLHELALELGADVPLFLVGGCMRIEGIGERVIAQGTGPDWYVLLVKPEESLSTRSVYERMDAILRSERPDHVGLLEAMARQDLRRCGSLIRNEMEEAVFREHPVVEQLKQEMLRQGAAGAGMTGSGSAVFGLFGVRKEAERAARVLEPGFASWVLPFVSQGCVLDG